MIIYIVMDWKIILKNYLRCFVCYVFVGVFGLNAHLASGSQAPDPNNGSFYIAHRTRIIMDGSLDEWQQFVPVNLNREHQVKYNNQDWRGEKDCGAKFWWAWDEKGIYLAAETIDDSISFPFSGYHAWANDCIQFALDIDDDNAQNDFRDDDHEFVVTRIDSQARVYEFVYGDAQQSGFRPFPCFVEASEDTIRYEVMIPWSVLGISSSMSGRHIGASLVVFDNDGENYRGWLEWTAGITVKKFTLPFANILFFDPDSPAIQSIPVQSFLSAQDTLEFWLYSRYARRNITYRLVENNETIFKKDLSIRSRSWQKIQIPALSLKWGNVRLEVAFKKSIHTFDLAIWSKQHISEQIAYLAQQAQVLKDLKKIDASANLQVKYWVDWLQDQFSSAASSFDYYNVMSQAKKRIDQVPNFYMNKPVFYDREFRILEQVYHSTREDVLKRYLVYLPAQFEIKQKYPLYVFLPGENETTEAYAKKIAQLFAQFEIPMIGLFPGEFPETEISYVTLLEVMDCIADAISKYSIDQRQLHIGGIGEGGAEALLLADRFPDRFASVTMLFSQAHKKLELKNLGETPVWLIEKESRQQERGEFIKQLQDAGSKVKCSFVDFDHITDFEGIYSKDYFDWILSRQKNLAPLQVKFQTGRKAPARAYWLEAMSRLDYSSPGLIEGVVDSNQVFITTTNLAGFKILIDRLPASTRFPLKVNVDLSASYEIEKKQDTIAFDLANHSWKIVSQPDFTLQKSPSLKGPAGEIFNKPIKFVYSTGHENEEFNKLTYDLVRKSARRNRRSYLDHRIIPDSLAVKQTVNSNLIIFGNEEANLLLKALSSKLPMQVHEGGVKFGYSHCSVAGVGAFYIYPNPMNPDFLVLVGIAPDLDGMKNLAKIWDISYFNTIYLYDYLIVENGVARNNYDHWIDFGHFDKNWQVPWYQPELKNGPKNWLSNILIGLDANQLSFNSNWRGGGKGSFTWKVYSKIEMAFQKKKYKWTNKVYTAFGQISVQEEKHWQAPEKSSDIIDYDSVIQFTLEKFIDPYISVSMNTQFKPGYDPRSGLLVSKFANPLQLSQSAGIAKNMFKREKVQVTTRVGYSAKEFIATDKSLRKRWTGDESRGVKIDGGIEWLTETKTELKPGMQWNGKLKLFQAIVSSIAEEKDPQKNWRKLDVHWEQTVTFKLSQYVLFNLLMKFIYDRDTSKGGQFLESASLGISYKLEGIEL